MRLSWVWKTDGYYTFKVKNRFGLALLTGSCVGKVTLKGEVGVSKLELPLTVCLMIVVIFGV